MRNLKLKEVAEMVYKYMKDNNTNLLTAFENTNVVLGKANPYTFEQIKQFLFKTDFDKH